MILQSVSPVIASVAVTPPAVIGQQIASTDGHQNDLAVMVESGGDSDASQSSREQTDASSVDSFDMSSAEKPKSKHSARQVLKDAVVGMYRKRKSVATPPTHVTDVALANQSAELSRRCSAPQGRHLANKAQLMVSTQISLAPSSSLKLPAKHKLTVQSRSGPGTPTEDESQRMSSMESLDSVASGRSPRSLMADELTHEAPQTAPVLLHKTDSVMIRMNRKIRSCLRLMPKAPDRHVDGADAKVRVVDLSSDDVPITPSILALTYCELLQLGRSSRQVVLFD